MLTTQLLFGMIPGVSDNTVEHYIIDACSNQSLHKWRKQVHSMAREY